jgi:hypothetical protein
MAIVLMTGYADAQTLFEPLPPNVVLLAAAPDFWTAG